VYERVEILHRFADIVLENGMELAQLLSLECGKPALEAYSGEVFNLLDLTRWYCKRAPRILAPRSIWLHLMLNRKSYVHYKPRGVVGVIAPWNFPLIIPMAEIVTALLAGNGVVVKPSEFTPLTAMRARELLLEAGVPADLVQIVNGYGETGAALIDAGIDKVVFTGSVATGKKVAAAAGERLIPCVLELGGKAPAIVLPDADIERTARSLVWGGFINSGQACVSVERVYAHREIHDLLLERIVDLTQKIRQGDPMESEVDVGAIIDPRQIEIARSQIADATARGATIHTGGEAGEGPGTFFAPTVLSGVTQECTVLREETFGPLLPICKVESTEEAIALANDSHLGLLAYVFTGDVRKGREIAERVEAGTVIVNDVLITYAMPETPWAGIKQSGLGKIHTAEALTNMCQTRHVNLPRIRGMKREIYWYPYRDATYDLLRRLVRLVMGRGWARFKRRAALPRDAAAVVLPDHDS
jgi:succinate-semialdehyde dehydrogenase/glutarate-semialdehyde dehydrogenase